MKLSKKELVKQIKSFLDKNRTRIQSIDIKYPDYRPEVFDGRDCYCKAISNEILTIKFSPKKYFIKR
jgi:hypothetical protein